MRTREKHAIDTEKRLLEGTQSQEHSCEVALAETVQANNTIFSNMHIIVFVAFVIC